MITAIVIGLILGGFAALAVNSYFYFKGHRAARHQRASDAILETGFWCEKHRKMVERSGADPVQATKALSIGLYMIGQPINPVPQACCTFTDDTILGVLARCDRKI